MKSDVFAAETIAALAFMRAAQQPDRLIYTFLPDGENQEEHLTLGALNLRAQAIAKLLLARAAPNSRILLLFPPGPDFIAGLFGCFYAGMPAVPTYPPDPARLDRTLPRLQSLVRDSQPAIALTTTPLLALADFVFQLAPELSQIRWFAVDDILAEDEPGSQPPEVSPQTVALIQYTSGSTREPRGVLLTHANLMHNSGLIHQGFGIHPDDRGVIWLPPYHDMGLIGGILQPLYANVHCTLLSPASFLQRPYRWLRAISHYRATTSGGPNFAYELCTRKVTAEQKAGLDLSSWEVAFTGAETIRWETLEAFSAAFESCGFRKSAFYPCYGLAESTLIVSGSRRGTGFSVLDLDPLEIGLGKIQHTSGDGGTYQKYVGSGRPLEGNRLMIADPITGKQSLLGQVGEICVAGPSVAQGYWNRPDDTRQVFHPGQEGDEDIYLHTGDLGFFDQGELYITGRIKDLIIIHGRNLYPQDIEFTMENSHPGLRSGCGAAFALEAGGEEHLVVVQEIKDSLVDNLDQATETIRQAISEAHDVQAHAIVLIKPRTIPKTSSGKIQRYACREAYLSGQLSVIYASELHKTDLEIPASIQNQPLLAKALKALEPDSRRALLESHLLEMAADLMNLPVSQLKADRPLSMAGLDSVVAVDLLSKIESELGVMLDMERVPVDITIKDLTGRVLGLLGAALPSRAIEPATPQNEYPLSQGQRALWFVQQLTPENVAHNIAVAVRIRSNVDPAALERAFHRLAARHPALRTTFGQLDGEPIQIVHERPKFTFQVEPVEGWSSAQIEGRFSEETYQPFDIANGPLMRICLFKRSPQEHLLSIVMHHLISDFWSLAILLSEAPKLYLQEIGVAPVNLKPLSADYRDHVRRQQEMLAGAEGERLLQFWRNRLSGTLPTLNLPTDRPRPPIQTDRGSAQFLRLPTALVSQLADIAREHRTSLFNLLLAGFEVLLHHYSGQEEIVLGTLKAGRTRSMARVVGYFINPVVLRCNLAGDPTFAKYLETVSTDVAAAFEHDEYPFPLLVEHLQPKRDLSRTPLFQVLFSWQKTTHLVDSDQIGAFALGEPRGGAEFDGFRLEPVSLTQRVVPFDLTLLVAETGGGLSATMEYNTDLFDASTIQRMLASYQTLLENIAAQPENHISQLPILTANDRNRILQLCATPPLPNPAPAHCVHTLFETQAAQRSKEIALICGKQRFTYDELNGQANRLAHYLILAGVRPGDRVGMLLERHGQAVVALLAIFKTGAIYVPIEPSNPPERIAFIMRNGSGTDFGAVKALITETALVDRLHGNTAHLIWLDREVDAIAKQPAHNPDIPLTGGDPAYVIYTSGSTGQPKGVLVSHGALASHSQVMQAHYHLSAQDRVLQFAAFSFDPSLEQIFPTLMAGARIVMRDAEIWPPQALYDAILREGVTVMNLPPAYWHQITRAWAEDGVRFPADQLRLVIVGGDILQPETLQLWKATPLCTARLLNAYGPTETTITATTFEVTPRLDEAAAWRRVPIGRPLPGRKVYILNRYAGLVPVGVPGELYIGGAALASGYLGREDLTEEKFLPDPYGGQPGERIYRTGDLARLRPDGEIEFLGRGDDQVKVRGFRVELGEIETSLANHPGVRNAAVLAQPEPSGDQRLIAYVALAEPEKTANAELTAYLRQQLPAYMIPSIFIRMDTLPLTSSGKIDRRALPHPQTDQLERFGGYAPPRSSLEEQVCQIWSEVLGVERVGIYDNFFDMGGHSLLATQLVSRLRSAYQVDFPLRDLFESPTVAALCETITNALAAGQSEGDIEELLAEIENLSEEDARRIVTGER